MDQTKKDQNKNCNNQKLNNQKKMCGKCGWQETENNSPWCESCHKEIYSSICKKCGNFKFGCESLLCHYQS
ncbi:MAG: hypothetical protein Satyrvirus21_10 [Satyrvirus sp.]|uniref:Uncharacterized protein n=1 Tax=Satyrvirus sp. TaxID=2487771 RepID=A0A3G5AE77_9VIRU|nr:MAG: hypothetical protein Satyrvirus21_10 [Satyrvirus sp.]